jgi:putative transposase
VIPYQRHTEQDLQILRRRHAVYQQARRQHPERWSQETRNLTPAGTVELISCRPKMERPRHQETNQGA